MNPLSGQSDYLKRVDSRSNDDEVPDPSKSNKKHQIGVSVDSIAAKTINPSAPGTKGKPTIVELNEEQVNLLQGNKDEKPVEVDRLVDAMMKESLIPKGSSKHAAAREQMTDVALYVLENANKFWNIKEDKYVRPEESGLAVPLTFTRDGHVVISLKSKLGKQLGEGGFGRVKNAIVLSFHKLEDAAKLTIAKGASKTMIPQSELGKKAVEIEKSMLLRLKELGGHRSVVSSVSITEYKAKDKIAKDQETEIELKRDVGNLEEKPKKEKIGILLEFCNGGDVKNFIENRFPSFPDEEVELIAEDILNGVVFLHNNKIFHSDLKPANIMLIQDVDGNVTGAKIADFGCARDLNDTEQLTYFTGDRTYHSPELRHLDAKMLAHITPELKEDKAKKTQAKQAHKIALANYESSKKIVDEKTTAVSQLPEAAGAEEKAIAQKELLEAQNASSKAKEEATAAVEAYTNAKTAHSNKKESLIDKYRKQVFSIDETILKSDIYAIGKIFEELFLGTKIIPKKMGDLQKKLEEAQTSLPIAKASLEKAKADLTKAEEAEQEKLTDEIERLTTLIKEIEGNIASIPEELKQFEQNTAKMQERLSPEIKKLIADMQTDDPSARLSVNDALSRFKELRSEGKIFITKQEQVTDASADEETAAVSATEETAPEAQEIASDEEIATSPATSPATMKIPEKFLRNLRKPYGL